MKSNGKWFCEIVDDPWGFLDELWWILISAPLFSKDLKDLVGFLRAAGPPGGCSLGGFRFPCVLLGF